MLQGFDLQRFWSAFEARIKQLASHFLDWLRYVLGLQRTEEERVAALPHPSLLDLANEADAVMAFEVQEGCLAEVETKLVDLRGSILEWQTPYHGTLHEDEALDRLWVSLLRLGLFEELRHLAGPCNLPFPSQVKALLDFCAEAFVASKARGEAYRARQPDGEIFAMGCIIWGEEYIGNFLRYNVRSMLSEDNLPALAEQGRIVFSIVTDATGEQRLRGDPIFDKVAEIADMEFTIIPDDVIGILRSGHLVRNFYILYGLLDHCSIYFAEGAGAHLFMIPVDCVVARGTLVNMANYRHEGYECCGGGNLVAETETFLPALDQRFSDAGPIRISTYELASLAFEHAHHYFQSQIIASENSDFGRHPRELFWPVEGGVEIHSVFIHPLFTTASGLAKYRRKHFANVDYGMIPRLFTHPGPVKLMDPSKAYVNNFTAAHRRYETTGRPFAYEDFLRCHDWTYPVQKRFFGQAQRLPCRLVGYTACNDVTQDVREISGLFGVECAADMSARETAGGSPQGLTR
ncbi:MAG: hypothetical protein JO339_24600 [Alphaproteobacteria bacterium]|nr:hypothetical protein [Alphaproteobacteria bacterium]